MIPVVIPAMIPVVIPAMRGRYAGMKKWRAALHFENLTSMTDVGDVSVVCPHCNALRGKGRSPWFILWGIYLHDTYKFDEFNLVVFNYARKLLLFRSIQLILDWNMSGSDLSEETIYKNL